MRSRARLVFVLAGVLLAYHCDLPGGCGPGEVTMSPYLSNLIDYTDPPSGMILESPSFEDFTIYFFEAVDRTTFSLEDHVQIHVITDYWAEEHGESIPVPADAYFLPQLTWACEEHRTCRPGTDDYNPNAADRLVLAVNATLRDRFTENTDTPYYTRVDILGRCPETPDPDEPCAAEPMLSHDGYALAANCRVLVGLTRDGERSSAPKGPRPTIYKVSPEEMEQAGAYVPPHQPLAFKFSDLMGFVNFWPNILAGLNLRYSEQASSFGGIPFDYTMLESDSAQGLLPGETYDLYFFSEVLASIVTPGIPPTMNRYGTALGLSSQLEDAPAPRAFSFTTSDVRILFPVHEPFSPDPDDWGKQLETGGFEEHAVFVEITEDVDRLMCQYGVHSGDITFSDYFPTYEEVHDEHGNRKKRAVVRIDVDVEGISVCDGMEINHRQRLEVHGLKRLDDGEWQYRGYDFLYVDPIVA